MSLTCLETLGINTLKQGDTYFSLLTGNTLALGDGDTFTAHSPIDGAKLSTFKSGLQLYLNRLP